MAVTRQQVFGIAKSWNISALLATSLALACQGPPARSKPWRHDQEKASAEATEKPTFSRHQADLAQRRERGSTLRIHMDAEPGSLDPLLASSIWAQRITTHTVFETLVRYHSSPSPGPGRFVPELATSYSVLGEGRELRFDLDASARFHDGRPLTAVDVQFSIDTLRHPRTGLSHFQEALADVSSVEIVGRDAVRVRLQRPNGYVLRALAELPILPEHVYGGKRSGRGGPPIGTGPYRIAEESPTGVTLRRSAEYWREAPSIETVVFVQEPDAAAALRAAKDGDIDIVPALIPEHYPTQATAPGMERFRVVKFSPATISYVVLQAQDSPFQYPAVRKAVAHLINHDVLVALAGGLARPVPGPIWPGGPGDGAAPAPIELDLDAAARLLEQAGFRDDDGDGVRSRSGSRLMVTALVTDEENAAREEILDALRKAGFVIDLRVGTPAVLLNRLREGEFALAFVEWSGYADRDLSPILESGGRRNYGRLQSPEIDQILAEIRRGFEPTERAPALAKLAKAVRDQAAIVALPAPDPHGLVHQRVLGLAVWDGWFAIDDLSLAAE